MSSSISLSPERLLKKREIQKITKYTPLVESQGGEFSPLVIGTSGYITALAKKLLQVVCSNQDSSSRHTCELWMTKISFSLQKSSANEILIRSRKVNGKQYTTFPSRGTLPLTLLTLTLK